MADNQQSETPKPIAPPVQSQPVFRGLQPEILKTPVGPIPSRIEKHSRGEEARTNDN